MIQTPLPIKLVPTSHENIETITITDSSFEIGRVQPPFSSWENKLVKTLSRQHAKIIVDQNTVYIKDLGSRNGTRLNNQKLNGQPVRLEEGDEICLSGKISYRISFSEQSKNDKTTLIEAAGEFIELFYEHDQAASIEKIESNTGKKNAKKRRSHIYKIGRVLQDMYKAFRDPINSTNNMILPVLIVLLIAVGGSLYYFHDETEEHIKQLIATKNYASATRIALEYQKKNPDNEKANHLLIEATLKNVVPEWLSEIKQTNFKKANFILTKARNSVVSASETDKILERLTWISGLKEFISQRGGINAPLMIYKHEVVLEKLIDRWEQDSQSQLQLLTLVPEYIPEFRDILNIALSDLRRLRSEKATYLPAIKQLKTTIQVALAEDNYPLLSSEFQIFTEKYPKVSGIILLQRDLSLYKKYIEALSVNNFASIIKLHAREQFSTPPFQSLLEKWYGTRVPDAQELNEYVVMATEWQVGNSLVALEKLKNLTHGLWGPYAEKRIIHYQSILKTFKHLRTKTNDSLYRQQFIEFYTQLDHREDRFFRSALEHEFNRIKEIKKPQGKTSFERAAITWKKYQNKGGIRARLRLEATMSPLYKQQADTLVKAVDEIKRARAVYLMLNMNIPLRWQALYSEITNEMKRQQQWLSDLKIVLQQPILDEKLSLLNVNLGNLQ